MEERETRFFEVFHEVSRAVLSVLSLRDVTHLIAKRIVSALPVKASALLLLDEESEEIVLVASHLLSRGFASEEPPQGDPGIQEALNGNPFQMKITDSETPSAYRDALEQENVGLVLSVPMVRGKKTIGMLRLYDEETRGFSADELELVSALADIGVVAIENARLFEEEGARLSKLLEKGGVDYDYEPRLEKYRVKAVGPSDIPPEKSYEYFRRLHRLTKVIASQMDMDKVPDVVVDEVTEALSVKGGSILWLNLATEELELVAAKGLSSEYLDKGPLQAGRSIPQVLEGKVVFIPVAGLDSRIQYPQAAEKEGISSILCVPILVKEKVRGVLRVYSSEKASYNAGEIEFIKSLAEIGGIAIINGKLYQARSHDYSFWRATMEYLGVEESEDASSE